MSEITRSSKVEPSGQGFDIVQIDSLNLLSEATRASAIDTYQRAFAESPYNENFTDEEATAALDSIVERKGNLLIGVLEGTVVSIAGGYRKSEETYFIEELAVAPDCQGHGYGRRTLRSLLRLAASQAPLRLQVRTTAANARAINLYESEAFTREPTTEAVAHRRIGGAISVDERLYLSKPPYNSSEPTARLRRVAVMYPSGNTTAIVFDQLLSVDRKLLNDQIMASWKVKSPDQPEIEQCCFVTPPLSPDSVCRVEMLGGEFCGNATRSAAWLVTGGANYSGLIEVSGVEDPLPFSTKDGQVTVGMPLPEAAGPARTLEEGLLVQLDGITQLVVTDPGKRQVKSPRQLLESLLAANSYGLAEQPAVGVSYFDTSIGKASFCVWVKEVATVFDETACGSGTSAIGIAVATKERRAVRLPVIQPSGEVITTRAEYEAGAGQVTSSAITGGITTLYDGEFTR
jgi:diaminopimelate epimerase/GNAT superfamily N-acetyltransferase